MSSQKFGFFILIAGAAALFATKPTEADVERLLRDQIEADIRNTRVDGETDLLSGILTLTCQYNAADCVDLIRATIKLEMRDYVVLRRVSVVQSDTRLECLAVLNQLYCPGFLNDSSKD